MPLGSRFLPFAALALALAFAAAVPAAATPVLSTGTGYLTTGAPSAVAIADLDEDGHPDLLTADGGVSKVDVLLGHGDGTFHSATAWDTTSVAATRVVVGDVNGDGHQDAVVTDGTTHWDVLLGDGTGGFGAPSQLSTTTPITDPILGDFNQDGHLDLIAMSAGSAAFVFLAGNGDGTFQGQLLYVVSAIQSAVGPSAVADLDGNGALDLAIPSAANNVVGLYGNLGAASFTFNMLAPVGTEPVGAAAGDLNGDGHPDVVVANGAASSISALLGDPAAPGSVTPATTYPAGSSPKAIALGAIDPGLDAVVPGSGGLTVLPGGGDGTFGAPVTYGAGTAATGAAVADLDGDGAADVASIDPSGVTVRLSLPRLDADATALDFGSAAAGATGATRTVTVTNDGGAPLVLDHVVVTGSDFAVTASTCTAPVAANATCAVTLGFHPAAAGAKTGTLELGGNATATRTITLSGTATAPPAQTTTTPTTTTPAPVPAPAAPAPVAKPRPLVLGTTTRFSDHGGKLHGASCPGAMAATARVNLSAAATFRLTAKARGKTVASTTHSLPSGRSTLTVCLTRAGLRLVRRHATLKATATLRITASGYAPATLTLPLRFTYRNLYRKPTRSARTSG